MMKENRRSFLKKSAKATMGIGLVPLLETSIFKPDFRDEFLSVGVCGPIEEQEMFESSGYTYLEPSVQGFLVPDQSDAAFQTNFERFRQMNIPIPVCNSFLPGSLKSVGPDHNQEAVLSYSETAFQRAQKVGIEHIVYGSGGSRRIPEDFSRGYARVQFVELLKKMAPLAEKYGVTLCLEPLRSQETNFINTLIDGADILREVNHQHAMMVCDYYHVTQEMRGPDDVVAAGPYIRHCHIAEDVERAAPGTRGDSFIEFFRALKQVGYQGRISVECRWKDKPSELPVAFNTLKEQIAQV